MRIGNINAAIASKQAAIIKVQEQIDSGKQASVVQQEPVAYVCPTSHATADGSMEDGPEYLEWADEASDYEKRVGIPLYTHPAPQAKPQPLSADRDARIAELERELAGVRKQMDAQKDEWLSWDAKRSALEKDAGRYCQLVRLFGVTKLPCLLESVVGDYVADGKQAIDEAIDAAMELGNSA